MIKNAVNQGNIMLWFKDYKWSEVEIWNTILVKLITVIIQANKFDVNWRFHKQYIISICSNDY